jgi:NAD(P)-dependent dehydrogenase (short-subunit alcohol dehydrogenase family)
LAAQRIIGGTGGIGRALSRSMASHGSTIIVVARTFRDAGVPGIAFIPADLSLMREAERVGNVLPIERELSDSYLSRLLILREIAARLGKDRLAARIGRRQRLRSVYALSPMHSATLIE